MISEHAMLVLMLLLAVAVVLLAVTLTIYSLKAESRLRRLESPIGHGEQAAATPGK